MRLSMKSPAQFLEHVRFERPAPAEPDACGAGHPHPYRAKLSEGGKVSPLAGLNVDREGSASASAPSDKAAQHLDLGVDVQLRRRSYPLGSPPHEVLDVRHQRPECSRLPKGGSRVDDWDEVAHGVGVARALTAACWPACLPARTSPAPWRRSGPSPPGDWPPPSGRS
jgi:hypothetical protein